MSGAIMNKVWDLFGVDPAQDTEDENEYDVEEYDEENEEIEERREKVIKKETEILNGTEAADNSEDISVTKNDGFETDIMADAENTEQEMEETKSLWFIVQKFQFLVLFVPLEFYNGFVQKILFLLPTTHIIYAPAKLLVKFSINEGFKLIGMQAVGIILLSVLSAILYKKGVEKINANGG